MKQKIALIFGGKSGEHEVSIKTAFSILKSVDFNKYEVSPVYITLDGEWMFQNTYLETPLNNESFVDFKNYLSLQNLFEFFGNMDVAFPVVHGPNGEDGTMQGLLEMLNIPYVGSGVAGSAMGMDKALMKTVFKQFNLPQGPYLSFTRHQIEDNMNDIVASIESTLGYPVFVKPANLGSSIGISKAKNTSELIDSLNLATKFDSKIVVESFISGHELEIGVLGHSELITSEVGEIKTTKEFYDYEAKYENQDVTELCIPADVPQSVKDRMSKLAKEAFQALECSGLSRVDFFWDEKTDTLYINEINTLPGFTPVSMYPMLFKEVGISYSVLINNLIELAFEKYDIKQQNQIIEIEKVKE